ncbi:MAG: hypothetical protein OXI40_03310 [Chloroflexota bacterium]|nr:hypothetical protein [Chloroflexota bacterium]
MEKKTAKQELSRRDFLRLAGIGTSGTLLAATGLPALAQDSPTAGEANIVMMYHSNEISDGEIEQFNNDSEGITLTRIDTDITRFFAMLAAGTAPHLLRTQAPDIPQYFARDVMLNLQPYFEASGALDFDDLAAPNDYYKVVSPTEIGQGDIYGMAKDWAPDGFLWLHTGLLEAAGIAVPDPATPLSEEEVAAMALEVTQKEGDRTLVTGFNTHTGFIDRFWMQMALMDGGSLFSDDFSRANVVGNDAVVDAISWFHDMMANGSMNSPLNPSVSWFGPDYANGQLAMVYTGYWFSGQLRGMATNPEEPIIGESMEAGHYQMHPMFTWKGVRKNLCVTAAGAIVTNPSFREAGADDNDAAWAAFEWFMADAPAHGRAASGWGLPALKSLNHLIPDDSPFDQQTLAVVNAEFDYSTDVLGFNPNLAGGEPMVPGATYMNNLEAALTGELAFDDMLQLIEDETNFAIEEGMFNI